MVGTGRVTAGAFFYAFLSAFALSGCASTARSPAALASTWPLATPASLGNSLEVAQILRGAFGAREITLQCAVNATSTQLHVVGLTSLGLRVFTIKYDGEHLEAEHAPQVPEFFKPEQLVNDLQLVLWPLSALQQTFAGTQWQVSEPHVGTRRLRRAGELIAEVHYADPNPWSGRAWIVHFDVPYTIGIESRLAQAAPHADETGR